MMKAAQPDNRRHQHDDDNTADRFLRRSDQPGEQSHQPAGHDTADQDDLPVKADHAEGQLIKSVFADNAHMGAYERQDKAYKITAYQVSHEYGAPHPE